MGESSRGDLRHIDSKIYFQGVFNFASRWALPSPREGNSHISWGNIFYGVGEIFCAIMPKAPYQHPL